MFGQRSRVAKRHDELEENSIFWWNGAQNTQIRSFELDQSILFGCQAQHRVFGTAHIQALGEIDLIE
jgi:hypothetical protein